MQNNTITPTILTADTPTNTYTITPITPTIITAISTGSDIINTTINNNNGYVPIRSRGRPVIFTPEQVKQKHNDYMKQYYQDNKAHICENSKKSHAKRLHAKHLLLKMSVQEVT